LERPHPVQRSHLPHRPEAPRLTAAQVSAEILQIALDDLPQGVG
jgi:hypothetical protein